MKIKAENMVGRRVREFRKRKKLTQAQLAEKINKTVEMVCHLENGTASTKISTLYDICDALDIQPHQLFTNLYDFETDKMYPELVDLFMGIAGNAARSHPSYLVCRSRNA